MTEAPTTQNAAAQSSSGGICLLTGDENGLLKSTAFGRSGAQSTVWTNQQSRDLGISTLIWGNYQRQQEVMLSRRNGAVEIWDASSQSMHTKVNAQGTPAGIGYSSSCDSLLSCSDRGVVDVWNDIHQLTSANTKEAAEKHKTFSIPVKPENDIRVMRLSLAQQPVFACGGQEAALRLYDVTTQKMVFQAKNLPHNFLNLRVPVFIRDLHFVEEPPDSKGGTFHKGKSFEIVTVSSHKHVQLYDTRAKRRPVRSVEFGEHALRSVCVVPDGRSVIVADTVGRIVRLSIADFKQMSVFKGAGGSVRSVTCHESLPLVASVSLDRCVRVHHLESRRMLQRTYLRSRLNCVLFQGHAEEDELGSYTQLNSGANIIDNVGIDTGMWRKLDRNTKELEAKIAQDRHEKAKRRIEELQDKHGDPALRRWRFAFSGFITGDGLDVPMQVKGVIFVNKKTRKIQGSYTSKSNNSQEWFPPGKLFGRLQEDGMLDLETRKREKTLSTLEGGVLLVKNEQSLIRLLGQNMKQKSRVWKLRMSLETETDEHEQNEPSRAKKSRTDKNEKTK